MVLLIIINCPRCVDSYDCTCLLVHEGEPDITNGSPFLLGDRVMWMQLHSFYDSPCVSMANGREKCPVCPSYAMMIDLCMIDYCLFYPFAKSIMCLVLYQSRGESPAGFTNVDFTAFTRDAVNTWMVVRRSSVLMCVNNRFELVCRAMVYDYFGILESELNVV